MYVIKMLLKETGKIRLIKKAKKAIKIGFIQQLKKSKLKLTLFFNNKKLMVKLKISLTKILKTYPFVPKIGTMKYIMQIVIRRSQILITITPNWEPTPFRIPSMILSIYIKIISKEKILKYAATSMFLYINILSSLEKKKKILAIKNENEKVTVKILEQTVFILLKFFPACNLAYSGISNPLKELTKKLANIKTGITIPFIRPYFEIAKE